MQWLGTSKYNIFLILLKFQNPCNQINVFIKKIMNIYLNVSYDFQSSMGLGKSRCDIPNGNIQEWVCPFSVIKKSSMDSGAQRWFYNIAPRM